MPAHMVYILLCMVYMRKHGELMLNKVKYDKLATGQPYPPDFDNSSLLISSMMCYLSKIWKIFTFFTSF